MSAAAPPDRGATHGRHPALRRRLRTWHLLLPWAAVMTPLCWWGLPSRDADGLLFGGGGAWSAERFNAAGAMRQRADRGGGADTDLDPLAGRDALLELTPDDAARAAILLRYRLYSRQPDEMITFMALQRMRPRQFDFDPRLYQYGGGYIYLIGGCIGATSTVGLTRLSPEIGFYLENPTHFGRFYVVARLVSLAFGAAALLAVVRLAGRAAGRRAGPFAFVCVAASPVFITAVLEAKPHLPSACLILWAINSALAFAARGRLADAVRSGLQAGYAFGLVLTGVVAGLLLPALLVLRRDRWRPIGLAAALFVGVYAGTNPYVLRNAVVDRAALGSNLANSTAMYSADRVAAGAARVGELLVEGCGRGVLLAGLIGVGLLAVRQPRGALLAAAPALGLLAIAVALGADKPAEYARFLILPVALLGSGAGVAFGLLAHWSRVASFALLIAAVAVAPTAAYVESFIRDAHGGTESRRVAGAYLAATAHRDDAVGVVQEPAPYAVPPLDFAHRRVVLLPATRPGTDAALLPAWLVLTADDEGRFAGAWWLDHYRLVTTFPGAAAPRSPIAWANKPVFVFLRRGP